MLLIILEVSTIGMRRVFAQDWLPVRKAAVINGISRNLPLGSIDFIDILSGKKR